ncbi:hypothetical protein ACIGW0_31305 [Streptomyces bikiniensis]|uniref:Uncharacterized protein n=1 Tax=Streptomyces bikiniensis TaxID=1896 RepID=A0ABW8D1V9_STRBI
MTEYTLTCDADPVDTLRASTDNSGVYVQVRRDERTTTTMFPTVEDTRTFARGLLALCDEADGGEVPKAQEVKVGDRVRVIRAEYAECTHGSTGEVTTVDAPNTYGGVAHPYRVRLDNTHRNHVYAAEVESISEEAEEPSGRRIPYDRDQTYTATNYVVQGAAVNNVGSSAPADVCPKVGDRVRVVRNAFEYEGDKNVGAVGTLVEIDAHDFQQGYRVVIGNDDEDGWWCAEVEPAPVDVVTEPTRSALIHQARDLLAGQTYTVDDLIRLADYLTEEER